MKTNYNFTLIDGKFTPPEAGRLLFKLISSEINYHAIENFSSRERSGKEIPHSERRINALKKVQNTLKEVFDLAEKQGLQLKIDGFIEVTILE